MNCRSTSTFPVNGEVIALVQRHDQEQFPTRPIWYCFQASVQERIKRNPFGAITLLREKKKKLIEFFLFRGGPSQGVQWFGGFRDTVMAYEAAVNAGLTISL